jgi:hypothetical protein
MAKHNDLISGSKQVGNSIAHTLKINFTNHPETINKMQNEEAKYRDEGLSKLFNYTWTDSEKKEIEERVMKQAKKILNKPEYSDIRIKISEEILEKEVKQQLTQFFGAMR